MAISLQTTLVAHNHVLQVELLGDEELLGVRTLDLMRPSDQAVLAEAHAALAEHDRQRLYAWRVRTDPASPAPASPAMTAAFLAAIRAIFPDFARVPDSPPLR